MKKLWQLLGIAAFWASWPGIWAYLRNTKRTRVILLSGSGKVLLLKGWLGPGQWGLPGGGVHKGEDPLEAAVREVREETKLELGPTDFHFREELTVREYGLSCQCRIYTVQLKDEPVVMPQKWEITEVKWLPKAALSNVGPATKQLLANWS